MTVASSYASQNRHGVSTIRGVTAVDGSSKARFERAALILFTERSIEQVTTKQIAAAAGLSEGLLYRYAKSKNELAADMFFSIHAQLGGLVRDIGVRTAPLEDKVRDLVMAYAQCADDDWVLFSYHLLNTHRFLGDDKSMDNPVAATEGILQEALDDGELDKEKLAGGNVTLLAAMVLGVVLQPALHKAFGRLTGPLRDFCPAMTAGILAILHTHRTIGERP
ncbi:MAG: TetR/AcrR family transcriptional regulator [Pseudomonadota bacterium]